MSRIKATDLHALYFDGTSYFVESNDGDFDIDEWELISTDNDIDYLYEESDRLNSEAYP